MIYWLSIFMEKLQVKKCYRSLFWWQNYISCWNTHIYQLMMLVFKKNGTYQTDAGMCVDYDSVIGMNKENSIIDF